VKTILLIIFLGLSQIGFSQYCLPPISIKSTSLSYSETPLSENNPNNYRFLYKLIIDCKSDQNANLDALYISTVGGGGVTPYYWILDSMKRITAQVDPCVVLPEAPCNVVYYFHTDVSSPDPTKPFIASTTNCCRLPNLINLNSGTNFTDLAPLPPPEQAVPGQFPPPAAPSCPHLSAGAVSNGIANYLIVPPASIPTANSPTFISDDSIPNICMKEEFSHKFTATDPEADSIAYHFSTPLTYEVIEIAGRSPTFLTNHRVSVPIPFSPNFTEEEPAGPSLKLDPKTGLISGMIPVTGFYDISVSAIAYRGGILLDSTIQDFYFAAFDCSILPQPKAITTDGFKSCSSFTVKFPDYSIPQYPDVLWNPTTVKWNFGDNDSSSDFSPIHTYADTGTYNVRLIVFPGYHCADTANTVAIVYPFVYCGYSYPDSCSGEPEEFINNSTSSSGKITGNLWQVFKGDNLLLTSTDSNAVFKFSIAPETYRIFLTVTNEKGCVSTDSQYVNIEKSPQPLSFHDTLLSYGATLQLKVDDGNFNYDGQFLWSPSFGLSDPFSPDPILNSTVDNTYYVSMKNKYGCAMTDSFNVKYYKGPSMYVPNAFTPNGDGKNDIFKPTYIGIVSLKYFRVFNRNGQLVFETNQQTKGWDGNLHGEPSPEGTYVWEVSGQDYLGKWESKSGTVILIK
jgi:gliding motility-associated-like protein